MNQHEDVMECSEIQRIVWTEGAGAAPAVHLSECEACAEQARRAADLQAALQGLQWREADVSDDLYASIISAVGRSRLDRARGIVSHPKFWRGAAVGVGAAAATAVAGLIVVRRRAGRPEGEPEPSLVA